MPDPFRGEVCAAWLDYLAELEPEVLQQVMQAVADSEVWSQDADRVRERTRDVYLFDLSYANARAHHPAMNFPRPTARRDIPGAI